MSNPIVKITVKNFGTMTAELYPDMAPVTVENFVKLVKEGFFEKNKIDTLFIFGGTNDSWCGSPLGEPKYADWQEQDLYCALPAISCLLKTARDQLPDTKIYCLLNTDMKPEFYEVFGRSCELYGVTPVPLENIRKSHGHPKVNHPGQSATFNTGATVHQQKDHSSLRERVMTGISKVWAFFQTQCCGTLNRPQYISKHSFYMY